MNRIDERSYAVVIAIYLIACLTLGGSSASGIYANLVLQLTAMCLAALGIKRLYNCVIPDTARTALLIVAATLVLVLVQLLPLPPSLWTMLPGRAMIADHYHLLGLPAPWLGISLSPWTTVGSGLAMLCPAAIFVATLTLATPYRPALGLCVVAFAAVSVLVGVLQVGGGSAQPFYIYAFSSKGSAVGTFANRNHFATLLLMAMPFLTLLLRSAGNRPLERGAVMGRRVSMVAVLALLCLGILLTGSRAGLALLLPLAALTYATILRTARGASSWPILAGAGVGAALMIAGLVYGPFYDRIVARTLGLGEESRFLIAPIVAKAGWVFAPFGTGLGTFDPVYRIAAGDQYLAVNFTNHAHNDYLESWLTGGVPAMVLLAAFLLWQYRASVDLWRLRSTGSSAVARAATIAVVAALLHATVDYALRTAAISGLFALAAALQVPPCVPAGQALHRDDPTRRRIRRRRISR